MSYETSREQIPRTVGRLRRMAVAQLHHLPKVCEGGTDREVWLAPLDIVARDLLAQRKGYELIQPDMEHAAGAGDPASAALVADLMAAMDPARPPGPALGAWLSQLRNDHRVDGVLVLRVEISCLRAEPATRGLLALFSFGVSEVVGIDYSKHSDEFLDAVVFETTSSRVVWRNAYGRLEQELLVKPPLSVLQDPPGETKFRAWAINHLLDPIEPAVPRLLTR
ncbi:MAG TPA: hypothetical protein VLE45_08710 [Burkholderiaceae bacterium]|nr:hypothetical protein [Burkholderiaceae bacterium]